MKGTPAMQSKKTLAVVIVAAISVIGYAIVRYLDQSNQTTEQGGEYK
ncbi:MAG: hypothetical protein LBJ08_02905 [Bifidobacteriaceae bacterium]|jgi:hypothetical protein|nr:hypothetical protein [Bifidobacteriaceae bacterium]